jgi:catechol 2,3-dioxygenase-like lactoylglutathione lyase family enzyme
MIDHLGVAVTDIERARAFYQSALNPLGIALVMEVTAEDTGGEAHSGFGAEGKPFFWIGTGANPKGGAHLTSFGGAHVEVDAFHRAAIAARGRVNGPPDHPNY